MKSYFRANIFRKVLLPVVHGCECKAALNLAHAIADAGEVVLVGMVAIPPEEPISMAAEPAAQVRRAMKSLSVKNHVRVGHVYVTHEPVRELIDIVLKEQPDLMILEWPGHFQTLNLLADDIIAQPPCNLALVSGNAPEKPRKILVPLRGGPYAELALRLSLAIAHSSNSRVSTLHLTPIQQEVQDIPYRGLARVLANLPEIHRQEIRTDNPVESILEATGEMDLIVIGASGQQHDHAHLLGPVADKLLKESAAGVVVVKTQRPLPLNMHDERVGQTAISVLVDKWFAENTYRADEFAELKYLMDLKERQETTISLALPALNEEETVGMVIDVIKGALMDNVPLLDEIILMDSDSSDRTREIAAERGIPVFVHQCTLERYGARHGKGEALWKSLYVTRGDILLWIDTDIVNIHPRFVYGLIGPLLIDPEIQFVKGFYRRPLKVNDKVQAGGGGRVTELTARPLINLFYPELSGVIQPLSGEYGGRRAALEQLPFFSGYGVEIGLLIDIVNRFGLDAIAQVDLHERIHHNQPLAALSKMSFAIIQAVIRKLEDRFDLGLIEEVNRTMKMIRYDSSSFYLDVEEIAEQERPPMIYLPEYHQREEN